MPTEPANGVPRIVDIFSPSDNQHLVAVRVPIEMASQYPDKPWLTPLSDLGIATKNNEKFADYVWVDAERVSDSPHIVWYFQKLPGAIWTTTAKEAPDLTPAKFKRFVTKIKTEQEVEPDTLPDEITGDLESSVVAQQPNTGKATKTNVTEEVDENVDPLEGQLTDTWGVNTTEEQLVVDGTAVESGFGVKASRVSPLGNGKSVKETENYPAVDDPVNAPYVIYTLTEEDTDPLTKVPITIKKSLVDAAQAETLSAAMRAAGWFTEIRAVDKWHSILISQNLSAAIAGVTQTWTETSNISLPDVLTEIGVIWDGDADGSAGAAGVNNIPTIISEGYRWSVEAEANATAVITGRPYTKIERGYSGPAEVTVVRTFHAAPPADTIEPYDFGEVYGTLTIYGAQKNAVAKASESGVGDVSLGEQVLERYHKDNNMAIHFFGPLVHNDVTLTETGDPKSQPSEYEATGGSTPDGGFYPTATANASVEGSATLELPTSGTPLASGETFVAGVDVSYYKLGYWVKEVRTAKVP